MFNLVLPVAGIMVAHKEFATAGKTAGLQIWRIENLDLKPVPKNLHGNFYIGDAYLLLYTTTAPSYYIHMWLGEWHCSISSCAPDVFIRIKVLSYNIRASLTQLRSATGDVFFFCEAAFGAFCKLDKAGSS